VLFEKRSLNKKYNPGKYGLVGGHVEKDDSFIETLNKEVKEEIGINISHYKPIFLGIAKPMGLYRSFSYNYLIFIDKKFNNLQIQELEVESIVYLDYQYVKNEVINDTNKFSITYDRFNEILNKLDSILYNSDLAKK
jgi:8-oxo-dGTP pyrophosphatase MutT (NUDIX family)